MSKLNFNEIQQDIEILDQIIKDDLSSNVVIINTIAEHIAFNRGKRIRPIITILCGKLLGHQEGKLLHKMAAMIEYIHTATLLHDDVVDESDLRRGKKTANSIFGNAASILVGDFIYTRSFQMMVESNSMPLMKLMAETTNKISEGEVLQLLNIGRIDLTEEQYFDIIESKTAVLFEASARIAAILLNSDQHIEKLLGQYAKNLGIAFQIIDDILDYIGDSSIMGKDPGDDLQEGKITLPIIYLLQNGTEEVKDIIRDSILNHDIQKLPELVSLVKSSQGINYCLNLANEYINKAIKSLEPFQDSSYKKIMIDIALQSINRIS